MSVAFQGEYSIDIFNAMKRYKMQYQKGVALADSELRELNDICYSLTRQLINNNFSTGSSTNDGFKVEQSALSNVNNFTIKGGDGTVNGAGVLFVDGYILFLRNDIEYTDQNATGAITDDDYTETAIPALTTPSGSGRTDEVYVDFYFAEVSADAGSEYQDIDLFVAGVGSATANRVRQVQDIRVVQGGTTPASGTDGNGIYHWRVKIATLNRLDGDTTITTAMITDDRKLVTPIEELSSFNPEEILFGAADGRPTQVSTFIRKTSGNVGIGTANPLVNLDVLATGNAEISVRAPATNSAMYSLRNINVTKSYIYRPQNSDDFRIATVSAGDVISIKEASGNTGIGTTDPLVKLHLYSTSDTGHRIDSSTSSPYIALSKAGTDKWKIIMERDTPVSGMLVNDLGFLKDATGVPKFILQYSTGNVGIGTTNPISSLQVEGDIIGKLTASPSNIGNVNRRIGTVYMASTIDYASNLSFNSSSTRVTFTTAGRVGIGSTIPAIELDIVGGIKTTGAVTVGNDLTVNGTTTTINTETTTADMMTINQDDNQEALQVNQTTAGNTAAVIRVTNAGTGPIATFVGIGTGTSYVGIGTTIPLSNLNIWGSNEAVSWQNFTVITSDAYAIDKGGSIGLGGRYTVAGVPVNFGAIAARKANAIDGNYAGYLALSSSVQYSGLVEAMRIDSVSNVGIGITNPLVRLHLYSTTDTGCKIDSSINSPYLSFAKAGVDIWQILMERNTPVSLLSNDLGFIKDGTGAPKFMLQYSTGNVGLGTTNPLRQFDVTKSTTSGADAIIPTVRAINTLVTQGSGGNFNAAAVDAVAGNGAVITQIASSYYAGADSGFLRTVTNHPLTIATNHVARVGIGTTAGINTYVGIGTFANISGRLDVYGGDVYVRDAVSPSFRVVRDSGGLLNLGVANASGTWGWGTNLAAGDSIIQSEFGKKLHIGIGTTSGTPTMTFSAGSIGIGTTIPLAKIHYLVPGTFDLSDAAMLIEHSQGAGSYGLDVRISGATASGLFVNRNDEVGIGTNGDSLGYALNIVGNVDCRGDLEVNSTTANATIIQYGSASTARLGLKKCRGTRAAPTILITGDDVAKININGFDGANYLVSASINSQIEGTVALTRMPGRLSFHTATDALPSVLTERMCIDSGGRVGIGTTNPLGENARVVIKDGAHGSALYLEGTTNGTYPLCTRVKQNNDYGIVGLNSSGGTNFYILGDGGVGIGTTPTVTRRLNIFGDNPGGSGGSELLFVNVASAGSAHLAKMTIGAAVLRGGFEATSSPGGTWLEIKTVTDNSIRFYINNTTRAATIAATTGDTTFHEDVICEKDLDVQGILTESSDERLKENIELITNALDTICNIRGVRFNWKDKLKGDKQQIGLIAQELEKIYPELVTTDGKGFKSISYNKIVAILIEAIKEEKLKREALEKRISVIEKMLKI